MTEEQRKELEAIDASLRSRQAWRRRFPPADPEAAVNLAQLMDDAGYFALTAETMKPELIAEVNSILYRIGVIHPANIEAFAAAILATANDEDLQARRRALLAERKED